MPLNIQVPNPALYSGAVLETVPTLDSVISSLPGLVGAWDAADQDGVGTSWLPRIGTGLITLAAAGVPPVKTTRDGRAVIRLALTSKCFVNDSVGSFVPPGNILYAARSYYSDTTTNFQIDLDIGADAFYHRPTFSGGRWQLSGALTGSVLITGGIGGWHSLVVTKNSTNAMQIQQDGGTVANLGTAGAQTFTACLLGDQSNAGSAARDITRLIICSAGALTADQRTAVNTWIGL